MTLNAPWRACAWLSCALVIVSTALAQTPADKALPDPNEVRLRAILGLNLGFKTYIFDGEQFPECAFDQPSKAEELLGLHTLKAVFYDAELQPVQTARRGGLYGAIVDVTPKEGQPFRRFFTLFRLADKLDAKARYKQEAAGELARATGLDASLVTLETSLIESVLKDRPFEEWARDPRAARLLAGLSRAKAEKVAARKNADALALDRQWWVDLKRKLAGFAKIYDKPFVSPRPIQGAAASVVREGTLAEAGMKADAVVKIDAVLTDWAANDDQAFAVCIVRKGVIVLHKAYGTRDGKPMTVTTKSWMASITKSMSASMMWALVDQGLVGLDDPIDKYLPTLRGIKVDRPVTIRHLYTHTNGLDKWPGWHDELPDVDERVALYYSRLKVGKEFGYNGTGYILGGKIVEAVTGEAVPLAFQHHLLDPLGCADTDVIGTHADAMSVPLDIAKFGQMLLNKGTYGTQRFIHEETFEKILPQPLTAVLGPEAKRSFGIGLDGKPDRFGHGAASAATFHVDRTEDLVVVMTRNKMGKVQDKYNGKFWDALKAGIDKKK
jgi:CubicO group peptidase (beta-lactamase class C family)